LRWLKGGNDTKKRHGFFSEFLEDFRGYICARQNFAGPDRKQWLWGQKQN
jgi:hypothetical protein